MKLMLKNLKSIIDEEREMRICNIQKTGAITVIDDIVYIEGVRMPICPGKGHNTTIVNEKVYMNGYQLVNGRWKKTLRALWYKWF